MSSPPFRLTSDLERSATELVVVTFLCRSMSDDRFETWVFHHALAKNVLDAILGHSQAFRDEFRNVRALDLCPEFL